MTFLFSKGDAREFKGDFFLTSNCFCNTETAACHDIFDDIKFHYSRIDNGQIPEVVKETLKKWIRTEKVELILYSEDHLGTFDALTILFSFGYLKEEIKRLQMEMDAYDFLRAHQLQITLCCFYGIRDEKELHFTYSYLNCQQKDLIYSASKNSWSLYGQIAEATKYKTAKKRLNLWVDQLEHAQSNSRPAVKFYRAVKNFKIELWLSLENFQMSNTFI